MTPAADGPVDPSPSLDEIGAALTVIAARSGEINAMVQRFMAGDLTVGGELVAVARLLAGP
ncbi:hypothetical protein [Pseudofrankia inefficax]|uniref:MutT/NUDIX family protein n=1 Tax=Pseudofrankia inefficax (strain DSM 45817 / CECT 9037 / DDB 130130 / EuI1c) TaxID=298654 RepID=E3J746_PSEI1|nr:hypothetical protein [Pseudofrankia inefficax]ADP84410.1 MutT/NUDIX family protein [Pseudofrankia inefficax]